MKRFVVLALACLSFSATAAPVAPPLAVLTANQINLDFGTPPIMVAKHSLAQRSSRLVRFYEMGAIGLDKDGMVKIRDTTGLSLVLRQIAEKLVDQENPERRSLIFAIAQAHGGNAAIPAVQEAQGKRWKEHFKSGWWMQDAQGHWGKKP